MSTIAKPTAPVAADRAMPAVANPYGHFSPDGTEFHITDPRTPRPWANIIANPRFGLAVSQTGSGFTWIENSQLAVITRWQQDLAQDASGRFLYLRDVDSGELWSLAPAPMWADGARHTCTHGLGYTTFETVHHDIVATWTLLVDAVLPIEYWRLALHNTGPRARRLELCAVIEWCCGVAPSPRREFHKLFIDTRYDARRRAIFARNHMWEVPNARWGHWNTDFPYVSAFTCTAPLTGATGDKVEFFGRYGDPRRPAALARERWRPAFGRHEDAIAALRCAVPLRPQQSADLGFALVVGDRPAAVEELLDTRVTVAAMDAALGEVRAGWRARLAAHRVETPDPAIDLLANDWLRYQAISGRLWGRCGYYQQSGAFGFRDQLQDSQVWLTSDPDRCRAQLNLHAAHQFADGSVYHWWHPLSEQGHITRMTDDLLWLAFVGANYIRETGDLAVLDDPAPFVDDATPHPLHEHVWRAFQRVFQRTSPRGLPYIGAGDWNDGLSAVGLREQGESVWLAHFLVGLLADWTELWRRRGDNGRSDDFRRRRAALIDAINAHAWDGQWYRRATLDDGRTLGASGDRVGRIFLNAQTWAVLNDVAPPDRAASCMAAVKRHLVSPAGALLLAPAFDRPDSAVGYITRYAPGLRENGGVYTHAATWAIAAACRVHDAELVARLLTAINPANKDPEQYWAEPYVLPGNVDGPDSPHHGRAGWTWYTGAAQWLHRVITHWVLGVRPEWDGLRIDPCLPAGWTRARQIRPWRGATYDVQIERVDGLRPGEVQITLNGQPHGGQVLPLPDRPGVRHVVHVRCG
jgi:cellobiose phosphorylase